MSSDSLKAIDTRYSKLSQSSCCLSCGGAINYGEPNLGEVCVDLGSGRGNDVIRMAEKVGPDGFAYGIDISEGMLRKARKTAERLGIKNVSFLESPLDKIPLDDCSVDVLISNCTVNHAPDKQAVWNEVYRVLKKGGRFVVSDIYSLRPVPEKYSQDPEAIAECWAGAVVKEEYLAALSKAGFPSVSMTISKELQ